MNYTFEKSDAMHTPIECFYYSTAELDFPIRPHYHYFMELIYILEGEAKIQTGSTICTAKTGDLVLFHPKSVHALASDDPKSLRFAGIKLDISRLNMPSDYAPKLRSIFLSAEQRGMDIHFPAETARSLCAKEIFTRCVEEMSAQRYGYDVMIRSEIHRLMIGILRVWQEKGFSVDSEVYAKDEGYDIYNITEYIEENIGGGVKVADAAKMCGMSYSYFAKLFQRVYGRACKEYMEEMRIIKAQDFLIFTDFDLTYISQETGFSDCSHLIKSFRRSTGETPKQFRSRYRTR